MTTNHPAALGLIRDNLTIPTLPEVVVRCQDRIRHVVAVSVLAPYT